MRRQWSLVLIAGFVVLGFLLVTAVASVRQTRLAAAPRKGELIELIESRRRLVAEEDRAVDTLRRQVRRAQRAAERRNALDAAETARFRRLAMEAGTVELEGPGLVVRLTDSERESPKDESAGAFRIHDDGWALMLPDPEEPLTHVWAEGTTDGEARALAQEYTRRIRQMLR